MNNKYKIIKTKDPAIIKHLLPCIEKLIIKSREDYSAESFIKWFRLVITDSLVGTWIVVKQGNRLIPGDSKLIGYLIATMGINFEEELMTITHLYCEDKSVTKQLVRTAEHWAKENGLKKAVGVTKRNPKVWERMHGYKLLSYNVVKNI